MINKKLNVGDYIFKPDGELARIIKVNKKTYSYEVITNCYETGNVNFNGIGHNYFCEHQEWFACDEPQAKALELAFKRYELATSVENVFEKNKKLIGKAKYFLEQIKDIKSIEVVEDE